MNNTRVHFLNEEKKVSWHFADIITMQNRQYGLQIHESGTFTAYDVKSGLMIGMYEHLINFADRINSNEFENILKSKEYKKTCTELKQALYYFNQNIESDR